MEIIKNISWRAVKVWQRNWTVYIETWLVNFVMPFFEPLLYLLAFGLGLGKLVKAVPYNGVLMPYLNFITPGLIGTIVMNYAFYETTYASFVRMYHQKTFDAILATPLLIEDIITGEFLWGTTKSIIAGTSMMIVASFFHLLKYPVSLWLIPLSALGGLTFSTIGMLFTSFIKTIEQFNFPVFLFMTPMFLFSGVFFPISVLPFWAQKIAYVFPLTYLVIMMRQIELNRFNIYFLYSIIILIGLTFIFFILSIKLMKKRLIK